MCHNDRFSHLLDMCLHTSRHHHMSHMLDTLHKTNKPSWTLVRGAKSLNLSLRSSTASSSKFHLKSATEERRNKLITHFWLRHHILSVFQEQKKFELLEHVLSCTELFFADKKRAHKNHDFVKYKTATRPKLLSKTCLDTLYSISFLL